MGSVPPIFLVYCIELFVWFVYVLWHLTNATCVYLLVIASSVLFKFYCFLNFSINVIGQYVLQPHEGINRYDSSAPGIFLLTFSTAREQM